MKIKGVIVGAIPFLLIPCSSTSADLPDAGASPLPQSSQLTTGTSGGDMRQSESDPPGFDSGLWRAEYLTQRADENDTRVGPSIDAFVYSNNLAMIPVKIPVIIGKSEHQAVRESDAEMSAPTMSDWEYAAVSATSSSKSKTIGFTTSGPSATSAIVGFVGTIIVIGAYASSVGRIK